MEQNKDKDIIDLFNRLLEKLHQTDGPHFGSHFTFINVEKGAQYVNHVGSQVFNTDKPEAPAKELAPSVESPELPAPLATPEAMVLWKKAQDAGWVNENYQPKLSRTQAALLAFEMAKRLCVREKWKLFGELWHQKNMYKYYYVALDQKQSLIFRDEVKTILG